MTIGTVQEKSLHAALKQWYARPGDQFEVKLGGYVIDIVRNGLLIEIQTRNFGALKHKLTTLVKSYPVRLVHPIPQERWIVRLSDDGQTAASRRKSPRRGRVEHIFKELVRIHDLMAHPNFSLEVLLTREEEIRVNDGQGSWRRNGWSIYDRTLTDVTQQIVFMTPRDFLTLLPADLPQCFTNRDLSDALRQPVAVAQKMTYCLHKMAVIGLAGKQGRALLYSR